MKDEPVPQEDNISRYCGGSHIQGGEIDGTAFRLRKGYDEFLSTNWLEFLKLGRRHEEIREIRRVLAAKMKVGSTAIIAVCNVGELLRHVEATTGGTVLEVTHQPEEIDPSHAGIFGYSFEEDLIADLIAEAFNDAGEKYSAIDHSGNRPV